MSPQVGFDIGQAVSHYRLQHYVGSGGMSVIYKAEDVLLGRIVALKFLSDRLGRDAPVVDRFRREARTASALNHPNICTIYEIGEHEGFPFIAMEYLEGSSLREVIRGHPLETGRLVDYALQIASGLEAAHSKGIIHRDLKPGNIFITTTGYAKILDFGLAKLTAPHAVAASQSTATDRSPEDRLSTEGTVMGTVAYMSPEQALGKELDARTDLFSFGVVLYEMATGILPFRGDTSAAVFDAILHSVPAPPVRMNPVLPAELERIIDACLEKDRDMRYQSATEICADLKRLQRDSSSSHTAVAEAKPRPKRRWRAWTAAGAVAALALAAAVWLTTPRTLVVTRIEPITRDGLAKSTPLSDGSRVYFSELWQERWTIAQLAAAGGDVSRLATPFANPVLVDIAPDHASLLVIEHPQTGTLSAFWSLPLPSGTPRRLGEMEGRDGAWTPDGTRLLVTRGPDLYMGRADGSEMRRMLEAPGILFDARMSPDGRRIRFTRFQTDNTLALWEANANGSRAHALLPGWRTPSAECCGAWSPDGRDYVFIDAKKGDVWDLPERGGWLGRRAGQPVQLTSGPLEFMAVSISPDGQTLYAPGTQPRGELVRFDAAQRKSVPYLGGISAGELAFSRDGRWVAYVSYPQDTLWRCRIDGSDALRLTTDTRSTLPSWSPDGSRIAYLSAVWGKPWKVNVVSAQGGLPQEMVPENKNEADPGWSPDGTQLIFGRSSNEADAEPLVIDTFDLRTKTLTQIPGSEGRFSPRWSPNGRFIAALSADSRSIGLYDVETRQWTEWYRASQGSVGYPAWASDSQSLYFESIMAGRPLVWRIRMGQHTAELAADLDGEHRFGGDWGSWTGIAPDGSVLFVRDASTQEIYALSLGRK